MMYTIIVDDDDREHDPENPWTAALLDADGFRSDPFVFGSSPEEAVRRLFQELSDEVVA